MGNEPSGRIRRGLSIAFAIGGYSVAAAFLAMGFSNGQWPFPGGDVVDFYARAGDALRAGTQVYIPGFLYGPPWAVAFAAFSWLGPAAIHVIVLIFDAIALWTIAGRDFRRLGFLLWFPLIPFELAAGQLNLLIAAAIVAAQRGTAWPLAAMSLAKVWPVLALPRRLWRPFLVATAVIAAISLPWLPLWPQWVAALVETSAHPLGPVVPVPFLVRAVFVVGLLALRRPWATALGTAISSPGLYWGQLVVLVAPVGLWLGRNDAPTARPVDVREAPNAPSRAASVVSGSA
jgi:hypothetical protein